MIRQRVYSIVSVETRALWAAVCFALVLYIPPILSVRYTHALFLLWVPVFFKEKGHRFISDLVLFVCVFLLITNLTKSLLQPSFLRDGVMFALFHPLTVVGAFQAGKDVASEKRSYPRMLVLFSMIGQAIICIVQIQHRNAGVFFMTIYSGDKYLNKILYLSNPRAGGTFGNPNYLGLLLLCGLVFVLSQKRIRISARLFLVSLFSVSIVLTRSRAAIMFCLVFSLFSSVMFTLTYAIKRRQNLILIPLIVLIVVGLGLFFLSSGPELFFEVSSFLGRRVVPNSSWGEEFSVRVEVWEQASVDANRIPELLLGRTYETRVIVDNLYLTLLIRYGIVGGILLLALLSALLMLADISSHNSPSFISGAILLTFVVSGWVAEYWFYPLFTSLYYFLISATLMANNGQKAKKERDVIY